MTHLMDTFPSLNPQDSCPCQGPPQRPLHRLFLTSAWTPNPEPKEVWPRLLGRLSEGTQLWGMGKSP